MIEISVVELRNNLRDYLRLVEQGEVLVITKRGKTIGRILPECGTLKSKMNGLVNAGAVSWGGKELSPWEPVAVNRGPELVSDLVREERDSGDDLI